MPGKEPAKQVTKEENDLAFQAQREEIIRKGQAEAARRAAEAQQAPVEND
jgi:hypothetical protein